MIEFTFMGRRYVVMIQRAETVEQGDAMPATQADLEAAGYQPFTRKAGQWGSQALCQLADQPAPTECNCICDGTCGCPCHDDEPGVDARRAETAADGTLCHTCPWASRAAHPDCAACVAETEPRGTPARKNCPNVLGGTDWCVLTEGHAGRCEYGR